PVSSVHRIHTHARAFNNRRPPSRLHTPRHYSVSAQVSAIPLRRRVVVELWWYEGALAPVDPQHRTGTRRDTGCVQRMVARAGTPSGTGGRVIPARGYLCSCGHELPRLSELFISARYVPTAVDLVYVWAQKSPRNQRGCGGRFQISEVFRGQ